MIRQTLPCLALVTVLSTSASAQLACGDCDMDGTIGILDALRQSQWALGSLGAPAPADLAVCDVDADGAIDVIDSLLTAQLILGLPVTVNCPAQRPEFGERVLLIQSDPDQVELTADSWNDADQLVRIRTIQEVMASYPTAAALRAEFWCVWVAGEGFTLASPISLPETIAYSASVVQQFVSEGGIFVAHVTNVPWPSPGAQLPFGFFAPVAGTFDSFPLTSDTDHELLTGSGFGGNLISSFTLSGTSCTAYRNIVPPAGYMDSAGVNLGTNPVPSSFNAIVRSPINGNEPCILEATGGAGYIVLTTIDFDRWNSCAIQPVSVLQQLADYLIYVRPNFNQ